MFQSKCSTVHMTRHVYKNQELRKSGLQCLQNQISVCAVLPPSGFISPHLILAQSLTIYLTTKLLMHVTKNYIDGFVFECSF